MRRESKNIVKQQSNNAGRKKHTQKKSEPYNIWQTITLISVHTTPFQGILFFLRLIFSLCLLWRKKDIKKWKKMKHFTWIKPADPHLCSCVCDYVARLSVILYYDLKRGTNDRQTHHVDENEKRWKTQNFEPKKWMLDCNNNNNNNSTRVEREKMKRNVYRCNKSPTERERLIWIFVCPLRRNNDSEMNTMRAKATNTMANMSDSGSV